MWFHWINTVMRRLIYFIRNFKIFQETIACNINGVKKEPVFSRHMLVYDIIYSASEHWLTYLITSLTMHTWHTGVNWCSCHKLKKIGLKQSMECFSFIWSQEVKKGAFFCVCCLRQRLATSDYKKFIINLGKWIQPLQFFSGLVMSRDFFLWKNSI